MKITGLREFWVILDVPDADEPDGWNVLVMTDPDKANESYRLRLKELDIPSDEIDSSFSYNGGATYQIGNGFISLQQGVEDIVI